MEVKMKDRFTVIRPFNPIFLCAIILILAIVAVGLISRDSGSEASKYLHITADNGVVLHVLKTDPSSITLRSVNDNVVQSGISGINGGFFWEDQLLSIAVMDGLPTNGSPKAYGSGWYNVKYARGTIVYDRVTSKIDVQRAASVADLQITDTTKFWAQGGVSMSLSDDSNWYNEAIIEEGLPAPDDERLRSAMAYDHSGDIYLVVTSTKCSAEQFRTAIKTTVAVGTLNEAIFLDGDGSSQLLAGNAKLMGDNRKVVQMIAISDE